MSMQKDRYNQQSSQQQQRANNAPHTPKNRVGINRQHSTMAQNPHKISPSKMFQLSETNFFNEMHNGAKEPKPSAAQQDIRLGMPTPETQDEQEDDSKTKKGLCGIKPACFKQMVLDPQSKPVAFFMMIIIIFSLISTLSAAYFACFGEPVDTGLIAFEMIMEICFLTDIMRNFFTQFFDPRDPRKKISDLFEIAKHYIRGGSFFFDVIACCSWPMRLLVHDMLEPDTVILLYLLRLCRLGKIFILMNMQVFAHNMRSWFRSRLIKLIQRNNSQGQDKMTDNTMIMLQIFIIKGFQVFRLLLFILILSYFLGCLWFIMTKHTTNGPDEFTFYNVNGLADLDPTQNLTIVVYFMFTTLSTVGFGDYNPKSEVERVIMTFILLIGVACFSWIMGQFIQILMQVQEVTADNEDSVTLYRWLLVLQNFNNNKPLPPEMVSKFEKYFQYYWKNNKNYAIADEEDQALLAELPVSIQSNIYKDFLFQDFLELFKVHFVFQKPERKQDPNGLIKYYEWQDAKYSGFMVSFLQALEPRCYEHGQYIYEEGDEVDEQVYVISRDTRKSINSVGIYAVGFEHDRQKYFHVRLGPKTIICGYENLFEKACEFTYKALMPVDAYGLRKRDMKPLLAQYPEFRKMIFQYTLSYYHDIVRKPMMQYKRNIYSSVCKRQTEEIMMRRIDQEITEKEAEFEAEYEKDWDAEDGEDDAQGSLKNELAKNIDRISKKVNRIEKRVQGLENI